MKRYFSFCILLMQFAHAQMPGLSISGNVKEQQSNNSMEYCTISIFDATTEDLVTGIVSDLQGNFIVDKLKPGLYNIEVSFIGFEAKRLEDVILSMAEPKVNIGTIFLGTDATLVNEVEVTALKSSVRYELDKKIVDVDKNIAAANGTAVDILATVPSIQTNIDGDVSLRGSTGFLVLINGRPSVLDANDALRQIPANTIDNIEII